MKALIKHRRSFAVFLVFCILVCCIPVTAETNKSIQKNENNIIESSSALKMEDLPENIQKLLPEINRDCAIYLTEPGETTRQYSVTDLYTLHTENKISGEGTLALHSVPIKYVDENNELKFIDTSIQQTNNIRNGYSFQNVANSFTVKFGTSATTGIFFDDVFSFSVKENVATKAAQNASKTDTQKVLYNQAFGTNTAIEYVSVENGVKENIILYKYTGQSRFDFVFRSETHIPVLAESGTTIWVANKNTPTDPEYRFLDLYAYDSYNPAVHAVKKQSGFRHINEDLHYELTKNLDGSYTITVVVPTEYLTHPEIVYPVTIDPSITHVSTNQIAQDNFANAATPDSVNDKDLTYLRFGKVNGYKNFAYHRFINPLPELPVNAYISSAKVKFTFRTGQNTPTASSGIKIGVMQATQHWKESTITWNNRPSASAEVQANIVYDGSYLSYFNADITEMVWDWYGGVKPNYGVKFTYTNENYNDYNSVVSTEGDAERAPVLSINYVKTGLADGTMYYLRNANSGYYLTIPNVVDGTTLLQTSFSGNFKQRFRLEYNYETLDYTLYVSAATDPELAVNIANDDSANDAFVQVGLLPSSGTLDSQRFRIKKNSDGTYSLLSNSSNYKKAVQVKNGSTNNLVTIVQYTDNGTATQKWHLERVVSNECSRAVTTMPITEGYEERKQNSENRYATMPREVLHANADILSTTIISATLAANAAEEDYPIASAMLLHFLGNTGEMYTITSEFIKDAPDIDAKRQEIFDKLDGAYDTLKVPNITVVYGRTRVDCYNGDTQNQYTDWKLSVNSCELWGKTIAAGTTSKQTVLYVRDYYDWDAGQMSSLFDVAASMLDFCHYAGVAQCFPVTGEATY